MLKLGGGDFVVDGVGGGSRFILLRCISGGMLRSLCGKTCTLVCPALGRKFNCPPLRTVGCNAPILSSPFSTVARVYNSSLVCFGPCSVGRVGGELLCLSGGSILGSCSLHIVRGCRGVTGQRTRSLSGLMGGVISCLL